MRPYIEENVKRIRRSIRAACQRSHRSEESVRIIAVTKSADADVLPWLQETRIKDAAENRWQVARDKLTHPAAQQFEWHFIGSLQTNKVKYIVPHFTWVHSVDRLELAEAISHEAKKSDKRMNLLLQVNIAEEPQKHGWRVEDVYKAARAIRELEGVSLRGLMTMAPLVTSMEDTRPVFRALYELLTDMRNHLAMEELTELSMGMSDDFPVAIEEGATMVRIGRQLVQPQVE